MKSKKKKNKDLNKQHDGAINGISGYGYEANFFVAKLVEMLLQNLSGNIIEITRTKRNVDVDDIFIKTKNGNIFCQCKNDLPPKKWTQRRVRCSINT